ncbi:hemoglobin [Porphyrobacter sp. MBR-155]|uniref:group III truncated hemoglobin n=1 Tax=Porphyrobacter sp. MBR-155 TaxID=3156464 RepID=UPI0033909A84
MEQSGADARTDSYAGSGARPPVSDHARRTREAKREEAESLGIDSEFIALLVERFYARIRADELLGPIFLQRITDWPQHLDKMNRFWRSILHNSGEFSGNPMVKHMAIPRLESRHFEHWLALFYATLSDIETSTQATWLVADKARMIADSLLTGIEVNRRGIGGARAGKELPHA